MTHLTPAGWLLFGLTSFLAVTVISYVWLCKTDKRRGIDEHSDEYWRGSR